MNVRGNHKGTIMQRLDRVESDLLDVKVSLGKKVDWKWFFGALLTQIGILTAISSAVWTEIKTVRDIATQTNVNVAKIQGALESAEITKE
jgi:hypothetical protein